MIEPPYPPRPERRTTSILVWMILLSLFSAILGGVIGSYLTSNQLLAQVQSTEQSALPTETETASPTTTSATELSYVSATDIQTRIVDTVDRVSPAVVTIIAETTIQSSFFGFTQDQESSGSGVIVSEDGYIITNHHVIEDADKITEK